MPPTVFTGGDVGHRSVIVASHQPGGFAGAENIDTGETRELCFCTETVTIDAHRRTVIYRRRYAPESHRRCQMACR